MWPKNLSTNESIKPDSIFQSSVTGILGYVVSRARCDFLGNEETGEGFRGHTVVFLSGGESDFISVMTTCTW